MISDQWQQKHLNDLQASKVCFRPVRTAVTDFSHHLEARPPVVQAAAMGTMASGVGTRANYAEVSMHLVQTISKEGSYYFFVVSDLVRLVLCSFWCCCCRQAPFPIGMGTRSSYPEANFPKQTFSCVISSVRQPNVWEAISVGKKSNYFLWHV